MSLSVPAASLPPSFQVVIDMDKIHTLAHPEPSLLGAEQSQRLGKGGLL